MKRYTLVYIFNKNYSKILLGYKKANLGAGYYNGFGGKVEKGETLVGCVKREVLEEVDLRVGKLQKIGILIFYPFEFPQGIEVHIYKTNIHNGDPTETKEMIPEWFSIAKIPYSKLWDSDKYWFQYLLNNTKFSGRFWFDNNNKVVEYNLNI